MSDQAAKPDFQIGKSAALEGDLITSQVHLSADADKRPQSSASFFLALAEFKNGRLEDARLRTKAFLTHKPDHPGALLLSARIHLERAKEQPPESLSAMREMALERLNRALTVKPDFPAAASLRDEIYGASSRQKMEATLSEFDQKFQKASSKEERAALRPLFDELVKEDAGKGWNNDPVMAKISFLQRAKDFNWAIANYDPRLVEVSVELDYITWPKRIQELVKGRSVLDVGCGFGGYGTGFLVAGATEYSGLDPQMNLESSRAKNKRIRKWSDMGITPREIMEQNPAISLYQGTAEEIDFEEKFDTISLHNVTEHLIYLEDVLAGLVPLCHQDTNIVYLHHNFYCWNGHHFAPNQPHQIDLDNAKHREVIDWGHIELVKDLPDDHYFKTRLNRVRLDDIREITERHFDIMIWDEIPSSEATLARFSDGILGRFQKTIPSLTKRDLIVNAVYCVARRKG